MSKFEFPADEMVRKLLANFFNPKIIDFDYLQETEEQLQQNSSILDYSSRSLIISILIPVILNFRGPYVCSKYLSKCKIADFRWIYQES